MVQERTYEAPRHRLISARISPMVELARWMFERQGLPYAEVSHAPIVHVLFTRLAGGGNEIPVVVSSEGVWDGGPAVIRRLDEKSPPQQRIFSDEPADYAGETAFVDMLFSKLLKQVRRHVYHQLLPFKTVIAPVVTEGAPRLERLFVFGVYPLWRWLMGKGLGFQPDLLAQAPLDISAAFDAVEERLAIGQRFLAGDMPGTLDILFAALAAPVIFPPEYGAMLPRVEELPPGLRTYIDSMRARRAGVLVLDTYRVARGTPQRPLRLGTAAASRIPPGLWRIVASLVRRIAPVASFGRTTVVSSWRDVQSILANDIAFQVGPVNGAKIERANGPFALGMDRGTRLLDERRVLYAALAATDMRRIEATIRSESRRLLAAAAASGGRIDVVNGYARLVAARAAVTLFGIAGPSEPDLLRATRAVFESVFLDLGNDPAIATRGEAAGREINGWIDAAITARRKAPFEADFLGVLLRAVDDNDLVRRTIAGMLVGAIDTTASATSYIMAECLARPDVRDAMSARADDPASLSGWCWELLRFRPHNPILLRRAASDALVGARTVGKGNTIFAVTLAAMHDPAAFPRPARIDPTRPAANYLHFGAGVHQCAGRAINAFQIPYLVGALLRAQATSDGGLLFRGPFPDRFVVKIATRP